MSDPVIVTTGNDEGADAATAFAAGVATEQAAEAQEDAAIATEMAAEANQTADAALDVALASVEHDHPDLREMVGSLTSRLDEIRSLLTKDESPREEVIIEGDAPDVPEPEEVKHKSPPKPTESKRYGSRTWFGG